MKKFFAIAFVAAVLVACEEKKADTPAPTGDSVTAPTTTTPDSLKKDSTVAPVDTTKKPA